MKILFWIFALASIPVGAFMSVTSWFMHGLDLAGTGIGVVVAVAGMLSLVVSIACAVLGFSKLRKGEVKKAVAVAVAGIAYSGIILAGVYIDDAVHTVLMERDIAERKEAMYGENWDAAPAIEGIPELYVDVLNEIYAIAKNNLDGDLMGFGVVRMPDYYGDAPMDNIGFTLMDVNGDSVEEMVLGTTAPVDGGTVIFAIYSDPENPFASVSSVEGEVYYLHADETEGDYLAEIVGMDAAWSLDVIEGERMVDINYQEGTMDPAGRQTLEMIPFSHYK